MTDTLRKLQEKNRQDIFTVQDERFKTYGRLVTGLDFSDSISYIRENTQIPKEGNQYVASLPKLEEGSLYKTVSRELYGGMEIQIGYCSGRSSGLNGMEYHKGSEVLVAVTDCMLFLGHIWDMKEEQYDSQLAEVFLIEKNQVIELYQTTLHLSPCRVYEKGFQSIIILPRGTNTDFEEECETKTAEGSILLKKNKWIIAHEEWQPLLSQGAKAGIKEKRRTLDYLEEKEKVE